MSVLPTIQQAINDKSWAWSEVATGYLDGEKAGTALSKGNHEISVMKCVGTWVDTYKLYVLARELGLFNRYPRLARPIQLAGVIVGVGNLLIFFGKAIEGIHGGPKKKDPSEKSPSWWNYTIRIQAIGLIVTTVLKFQKQPIQAVTFFSAGAVAVGAELAKVSIVKKALNATAYVADGNLCWNGSWTQRGLIVAQRIVHEVARQVE